MAGALNVADPIAARAAAEPARLRSEDIESLCGMVAVGPPLYLY